MSVQATPVETEEYAQMALTCTVASALRVGRDHSVPLVIIFQLIYLFSLTIMHTQILTIQRVPEDEK